MIQETRVPSATRTYTEVLQNRRGAALTIMLLAVLAGATEALGLASLIPLLRDGLGNTAGRQPHLYVASFFGLVIMSVVFRAASELLLSRLIGQVERDGRLRLLRALLNVEWKRSVALRHGDLVSALMSEATQVSNGVSAYLQAVSALIIAAAMGVTVAAIAPPLVAGAAVLAAVTVWMFRQGARRSADLERRFANANSQLNEHTSSLLNNMKFLRSTGARGEVARSMSVQVEEMRLARLGSARVPVVMRGTVEALGVAFLSGVLLFAAVVWGDVAKALVFLAGFYRVVPRLHVAQSQLLIARAQSVWWDRWQSRLGELEAGLPNPTESRPAAPRRAPLVLDQVTVTYPGRVEPALKGASLRLEPGSVVALIGRTGGGKSTMLDAVTGLLSPDHGRVLVGGEDLAHLDLDEWQQRIGLVPQDPPVIHASLFDNVCWLSSVSDKPRALAAIHEAQLDDLVDGLPDGLETVIGARGAALSGGQRQRLAIARALYRDPDVLILDEATSALDQATEAAVLDAILRRPSRRLTLFVTHRTTTIALADRALVIDGGRLVFDGSPNGALNVVQGELHAATGRGT